MDQDSPKNVTQTSTRKNRRTEQQPGRYLCVDTRKEQIYAPRVQPSSIYTHNIPSSTTRLKYGPKDVCQNVLTKKNLRAVRHRAIQPDSHCKFKTALAIDYVRDILEENTTKPRPKSCQNNLKKNGPLKPLLGANQLALGPNVTKCLGIQNDRHKKFVTLDDGLEVRENMMSPGSTRFSSAVKNISQKTLTIDLRRLSFVEQSESATDCSIIYGVQGEKNPSMMTHNGFKSENSSDDCNQRDDRHWSDFQYDHVIDDIDNDQDIDNTNNAEDIDDIGTDGDIVDIGNDEGIDDVQFQNDDYVTDLCSQQLNYDCIDGGATDYIDVIRNANRDYDSISGDIDGDIGDNLGLDEINNQSFQDRKTLKERNHGRVSIADEFRNMDQSSSSPRSEGQIFTRSVISSDKDELSEEFTLEDDHPVHKKADELRFIDSQTDDKSGHTVLNKSHPRTPARDILPNTNVNPLFSQNNSTTSLLKPHVLVSKLTKESGQLFEETQLTNANKNTIADRSSSESNHSLKSSTGQDQDSIHVKDIWKALVDGGYDITREEVSKYKVNSTKPPRVKSAPVRRISSWNNTLRRDFPPRSRSALHREEKLKRECSGDVNEEKESKEKVMTRYTSVGGCFQEQSSGTKHDQGSLEVVAIRKPVTKLLRKKNVPLVPPLNFQINTIPKSGHFFYFAYGLNMNPKRLEIQLRCETSVRYWGLLFGFRLLFNKKGSAEGCVGFPNIIHEPGFSVEGCVYELSLDCLPLLDTCVGFPKHYSRLVLPVWMCNSLNPDEHGVAQHCIPAIVHVAQDDWVSSDPQMLDISFTSKQCLIGTDMLSSNYQRFLNSFMQKTVTSENLV